jgi:hypothetical protein
MVLSHCLNPVGDLQRVGGGIEFRIKQFAIPLATTVRSPDRDIVSAAMGSAHAAWRSPGRLERKGFP